MLMQIQMKRIAKSRFEATKLSPVASRASRVVAAGEYLNRLLGAPACHAVDILASGGGERRREEDGDGDEDGDADGEEGDASIL